MTAGIAVNGIDHIVLCVTDVEASLDFYIGALGLAPWRVDEWRAGNVSFPSARVSNSFIIDFVCGAHDGQNLDHLCLVVDETDFEAIKDQGRLDVESGPARRSGARGDGTSIYVRDPDGNLIELRYYSV